MVRYESKKYRCVDCRYWDLRCTYFDISTPTPARKISCSQFIPYRGKFMPRRKWTEEEKKAHSAKMKAKPKGTRVRPSYKAAVHEMCKYCMGYENYVQFIKECSADECPLHALRPYK